MKYKVEILPQTPNALFTQRENGLTHSPFSLELALYTALKNGDEASMRLAMEDYFAAGFVIGNTLAAGRSNWYVLLRNPRRDARFPRK